jgi:predicted Ser/Thr protein kinase
VGGYRLVATIGEGGMGVVHLAEAPDGRRVALKVLRPHVVGDREGRERLAREVVSLRRVRSPRIAEVLDADPWGTTPFVATRYVPGRSLHEQVRQDGPLRGEELRHVAVGLAEATVAVHSVGVLHRDIKPSNVLLEGRSPVLIDFGLARLADDPRLTTTGWLLGTPGYLAPEILYGEDATTASDVHSWAATVVFAATGRPPFGGGPAVAVMDRVRRGEHDLAGVPDELLPLLRAALAPDPRSRPGLAALLAELQPRRVRADHAHEPTVPLALGSCWPAAADPDTATAVTSVASSAAQLDRVQALAGTFVEEDPAAPRTTPLTSLHQPARSPYAQPLPLDPIPASGGALPRLQRGLLLTGLWALVALGFAGAPYLSLAVLGVLALGVRTWSWTTEAVGVRQWRRGRRWYDGPLAAASFPWYLLVATGGTCLLLLWSAALAFLVGLALLPLRGPLEAVLVVMGTVLACSLWWGPGGRRLRIPTRAVLLRATRPPATGWAAVLAVAVASAVAGYLLVTQGVAWDPQPGPPWRRDTMLGQLLRHL